MNPLRRLDLNRPVTFTRGTAIMVGLVLGIILGGLFVLGQQGLDRANDAGERLAENQRQLIAAVDRLEAIERPTASRERAAIDRVLKRLTRPQLRRLLRGLISAAAPADRRVLRRLATPTPRAAPRQRRPPRRSRPPRRRRPTPGARNPQRPTDPAGPQTPAPSPPTPTPPPPPPLIPTLPGLPSLPGLPLP